MIHSKVQKKLHQAHLYNLWYILGTFWQKPGKCQTLCLKSAQFTVQKSGLKSVWKACSYDTRSCIHTLMPTNTISMYTQHHLPRFSLRVPLQKKLRCLWNSVGYSVEATEEMQIGCGRLDSSLHNFPFYQTVTFLQARAECHLRNNWLNMGGLYKRMVVQSRYVSCLCMFSLDMHDRPEEYHIRQFIIFHAVIPGARKSFSLFHPLYCTLVC